MSASHTETTATTREFVQELHNEADLCRNETAVDVANLLDSAAVQLERLRLFAERIVAQGHWEAGCHCAKCSNSVDAEIALGRTPRQRQHWFGMAEGPEDGK